MKLSWRFLFIILILLHFVNADFNYERPKNGKGRIWMANLNEYFLSHKTLLPKSTAPTRGPARRAKFEQQTTTKAPEEGAAEEKPKEEGAPEGGGGGGEEAPADP